MVEAGEEYMNEISLLLSIIRCEVCQNEEFNKNNISDSIIALFTLSVKHNLSHIVASALGKENLLGIDKLAKQFKQHLMLAIYQREQKNYELKEISDIFDKANIPYIPLKGEVLCQYYPEPWMRTSCDIDILVHNEDVEETIMRLCEFGYKRGVDSTFYDCSLFSPSGVHLELHYMLTQENKNLAADQILKSVWDYAIPKEEGSYCYVMENEMFMFYHIAHMAKHFMHGGCGIRSFIDLWLLRKKMMIDVEKFETMLNTAELTAFYRAACYLSEVWFEEKEHNDLSKKMEEYVLSGGIYGSAANVSAVMTAKGERRTRFLGKLLFLSRTSLAIIYPNLRKYPILFPYYQIKRWFRVLVKGRWKKIKTLIIARNSVTDEEVYATSMMLEELDLF